jgi:hypothetical protein
MPQHRDLDGIRRRAEADLSENSSDHNERE